MISQPEMSSRCVDDNGPPRQLNNTSSSGALRMVWTMPSSMPIHTPHYNTVYTSLVSGFLEKV